MIAYYIQIKSGHDLKIFFLKYERYQDIAENTQKKTEVQIYGLLSQAMTVSQPFISQGHNWSQLGMFCFLKSHSCSYYFCLYLTKVLFNEIAGSISHNISSYN